MSETEKDFQISDIEEKFCCTSMQTFTDDFPLYSVQNLPVIASKSEEKFDFSPSNVVAGVEICNVTWGHVLKGRGCVSAFLAS